jgi:hypothetical protein
MQRLIDSSLQAYYQPRKLRSIKRLRIITMTDGFVIAYATPTGEVT